MRFGILSLAVGCYMNWLLQHARITVDLSTWYVQLTLIPMVVALALEICGCIFSLGERLVMQKVLFEEG